jgi:DNA helicase II / ATP-dependent DNA helicase PcrA
MKKPGSSSNSNREAPAEKKKPAYINSVLPVNPVTQHVPSENFEASDTSDLQNGQKIEHQKFGFGTVDKVEGSAHNPIATIIFENNGEKKIMLNYAKLRIVVE